MAKTTVTTFGNVWIGCYSESWIQMFPNYSIKHLGFYGSDYTAHYGWNWCAIRSAVAVEDLRKRKRFLFEPMWMTNEYKARGKEHMYEEGAKFNHYLQRCARDLKGWNPCRFRYMPRRVKQLQEHIDTLQNAPPSGATLQLRIAQQFEDCFGMYGKEVSRLFLSFPSGNVLLSVKDCYSPNNVVYILMSLKLMQRVLRWLIADPRSRNKD
ncbi:hypothetical protein L484_026577 [Morus notabilis]|uniref:Uncharacterized protein n=1 Tax=Morus notabilis TaxID=981085 RepID=W9SKC5_9ROSA|nr:hypothetical protein L484_026577 [Morus notabilis]